jgi:hypothetical protein
MPLMFFCVNIDCLIKELGFENSVGNIVYTPTKYVLCSFGNSTKDEEQKSVTFTGACAYEIIPNG